jgi:hypothetical protein
MNPQETKNGELSGWRIQHGLPGEVEESLGKVPASAAHLLSVDPAPSLRLHLKNRDLGLDRGKRIPRKPPTLKQ